MKIEILNGPNLNMLGMREPEIYGTITLAEIEALSRSHAQALGIEVEFRQSNHEGEIVEWIQKARGVTDGIIINPAAYTFTSIAILDAFKTYTAPIVEVHLANIHQRESFRHFSYVSLVAKSVVCGMGEFGYLAALDFFKRRAQGDR